MFVKILCVCTNLNKSLSHLENYDCCRTDSHSSRDGHIEKRRQKDRKAEDLICRVHGGQETSGHLSDEVAGEVGRVYRRLDFDCPVEWRVFD